MSTEKTDALVIRLADFSESSRVVTLFSRDFGKLSALAKGAKRLKSAFESGLDLLSESRIVFIHKSSGNLDLLTEAKLVKRFQPVKTSLNHLYGGYYIAELLNALTEPGDPHPELYEAATETLLALEKDHPAGLPILKFELTTLHEIGQLPDFDSCTICHSPIELGQRGRFWVSQGGLICTECGVPEYERTEISGGSIAVIRRLINDHSQLSQRITITPQQLKDVRRLVTSAVSHAMGRRPKTLSMLKF